MPKRLKIRQRKVFLGYQSGDVFVIPAHEPVNALKAVQECWQGLQPNSLLLVLSLCVFAYY